MMQSDLIVIGAGIQGASAAYNLAKRGYGRVLVLEQGTPDDLGGSTPRSASMIMQQTGNTQLSRLARRSYAILQSLEAELEIETRTCKRCFRLLLELPDEQILRCYSHLLLF